MKQHLVLLLGVVFSACVQSTPEENGARLVASPSLSDSRFNSFACVDCHRMGASDRPSLLLPGGDLAGAYSRPSWWTGSFLSLHDAVSFCYTHFMDGDVLPREGANAQAVLAYLRLLDQSASPAQRAAVPLAIPNPVHDVLPADANRGAEVYATACARCHGDLHTGRGRIDESATLVPDDTFNQHLTTYGPACTRVVIIEKIRHGSFFGFAGRMPPFSENVLSDTQLADLLAYLGTARDGVCQP